MNERIVASELLVLAKELLGIEFDTKEEMDDYKREHTVRRDTKLTLKPEAKKPEPEKSEEQKRKDERDKAMEPIKKWGKFSNLMKKRGDGKITFKELKEGVEALYPGGKEQANKDFERYRKNGTGPDGRLPGWGGAFDKDWDLYERRMKQEGLS
jgi:hypothetical protein